MIRIAISHRLTRSARTAAVALTASVLAVLAGGAAAATPPASARDAAVLAEVHGFYTWYLGELRAGRRPATEGARLRGFMTDGAIDRVRRWELPAFDPVLMLPEPHANWQSMKVSVARPRYYHERGIHDAYVEVTYSGFTDPEAHISHGVHIVGTPEDWIIGLDRTPAGWRIASIAVAE